MSHKNTLRNDKTCLNCNYVVENRFCPNCGQENADTRKTFYLLFVHFFEDLTHYENAFWRTIKNLLLKPAALTKEYLSGKRLSYLAPIRLYIFINFLTFFLIAVFPDSEKSDFITFNAKKPPENKIELQNIHKQELKLKKLQKDGILTKSEVDSIQKVIETAKKSTVNDNDNHIDFGYSTIRELDSAKKKSSINDLEYYFNKKVITISKYNATEIKEKFMESAKHNIPKTLFIYMPLFALVLWIFHNKKRWYYFDHGIFTLHYFSFLLLIILFLFLINKLFLLLGDSSFISAIKVILNFTAYGWMFYYFFPAHHRFYGETKMISFIKSISMLLINSILITIILVLFVIYTFFNIH